MSDKKQISEQPNQSEQSSGEDNTDRSGNEATAKPTTLPEPPSPIMRSSSGEKQFGESSDGSNTENRGSSSEKVHISETKDK